MKFLRFVLLATAFAQSTTSSDPSNINNNNLSVRGALSFKDIVQDPTQRYANDDGGELLIVGGSEVEAHSVPHQAFLLMDGQYFCGGSLISNSWVLTSASCLYGRYTVLVTLGAHNINQLESTQQKITSTSIIIHPNWNKKTLENDVALIKLQNNATINGYVSPVCLVPSKTSIKDGTTMVATGWGKTSDSAPNIATSVLRSVSVPIISNQQCSQSFSRPTITDGMMCTNSSGGKATCNGDSGGPLTISDRSVNGTPNKRQCQAGISSFISDSGCQAGGAAGFTRVSYYIDDFITKTTGIEPCNECSSGSDIINPSLFVLFFSVLLLRFTALF